MAVIYIPPSKNVGESVHDINTNFENLDKEIYSNTQEIDKLGTQIQQNKSDIATLKTTKANVSDVYTKTQTDDKITERVSEIVAEAPKEFDTLKEMSDWLKNHESSAATMNTAIQKNASDISGLVSKTDATNSVVNNLSTNLQTAFNQLNSKFDKSGGTLDEDATITIQGSSDNRYAVYKQGSVEWYVPSDNTAWANSIRARNQDGEVLNAFGAYGETNSFKYWFFGKAFNDKVVTIYPTGEVVANKFTGSLNGNATTSTYATRSGKLSNTQKLIKTISTSQSSPLSIIETSLFTNYNLILCNAVTSSNRYSVILPMKRIKSLGTSGRYEPFTDLMFTYVNDNTMKIYTGLGQSNPTITKLELIEIG